MRSFEFESFEEAYPELLKILLTEGENVSPRGFLTKEITPVGITIKNPRKGIYYNPLRKANYGFQIAELLWILKGSNNLAEIAHYNGQWNNFTDDGITLNGAYGDRIFNYKSSILTKDENGNENYTPVLVNQFEMAYQQLKKDPDTRQATIVLFNPGSDFSETKDKPCTNLMRFMIRNGKLNMTVFMRSNDINRGAIYDIPNFVHIQAIMASKLGVEMGKYTHIADSFHLYESDFEIAQKLIDNPSPSIYEGELMTNLIPSNIVDSELQKIFNIEILTRRIANIIDLNKIENMLNEVQSEYWRSLATVIAIYNIRKAKRPQEDVDYLKYLVTNEFSIIIKDWKTLKKD